jgi:hypothetical protein
LLLSGWNDKKAQYFFRESRMMHNWLNVHDGLAAAGRIRSVSSIRDRVSVGEVAILLFCGMTSALAVSFVRLGLRLPGHAIILAFAPMVLGLALAPRRFSGFIMSAGAFSTASALGLLGLADIGSGSFVSLCLIGPVMDFALNKAKSGWRLYLGLVLAGLSTNLLALSSRAVSKIIGLDPGTRPFGSWWTQAIMTYALCGALAGLIGALCFFHFRKKADSGSSL